MSSKTRQLAVLFDWENMQQGPLVERVLAAVNEYGTPVIRRAYGNWDNSDIAIWKKCLAAHKIDTIQLLDYSDAKNAADRTLINDATNILLSGAVDGFCIVSNDSDFIDLVSLLRHKRMFVLGIGKEDAALPFQKACSRFLCIEELPHPAGRDQIQNAVSGWKETAKKAIQISASADGWILLSLLQENIKKIDPSFNFHDFCHSGTLSLVQSCPDEFEAANYLEKGKPAAWHVRIRQDPRQ